MGFSLKTRFAIWVMIRITTMLSISSHSRCYGESYDSKSLSAFFRDRANESISRPQTGMLYNISLPSNFTGMEAKFVRLRSGSFRNRGANFSSVHIPQNVVPEPFVDRFAIVYEDLGNWSSSYYKVPNYSLVAPVIGFTVYDSPRILGDKKISLGTRGRPISILFDKIRMGLENGTETVTPKCVRFGDDGGFEIEDMSFAYGCFATSQGFFSLVVPSSGGVRVKRKRYLRWWLIGFGGGFVGIVCFVLAAVAIFKAVKRNRVTVMEKESENGVSFGTFWIGGAARMPTASMVRTQPAIEHSFTI